MAPASTFPPMTSFPLTTPAHLHSGAPRSGATQRHGEQRRNYSTQVLVFSEMASAYSRSSRGGAGRLDPLARVRVLGRLRALWVLAIALGWVKLARLLSVLFALLQGTLQHQRREDHEAGIAQCTRPRISRPNVNAGVEPHLTASF